MKKAVLTILVFIMAACLCWPERPQAADPYLDSLQNVTTSSQVVVVEGSVNSIRATVRLYEKSGQRWELKRISPAVTGKSGLSFSKKEGDGATPAGLFPIGRFFGYAPMPAGLKSGVSYTRTNRFHYWVDDPSSAEYNQWRYETGDPRKRWKSFERMNHELYKYGVVINYNDNPVVKGAGSAIFFHRWRSGTSPTEGCIALSESHLLVMMKWLDPKKAPVVAIGTPDALPDALLTAGR